MSNDELQQIDPQQQSIIDALIAQERPGKGEEAADVALDAELAKLSPDALQELLKQAYQEDANANSRVIRKVTALMEAAGQGKEAGEIVSQARSESWRDLLGNKLGSKAHELLADQTTETALGEHVDSLLEGLAEKLPDLVKDLDSGDEGALQRLTEVLAADALKEAQSFIDNSDQAKDVLMWIGNWVDENPGYVLAMAVLAGVGAVVADMDIPEIEQKFKLGNGFSIGGALDPGSLRNITIESAKLNLEYMSGQFTLKAGGEYNQEDGAQGTVSARYGNKEDFIEAHGSIDPEGNIVAGLRGAFEEGLFKGEGSAQQNFGTDEFSANATLSYGTEERNIQTTARLNPDGTLKLNLDAEYAQGLFSGQLGAEHNDGELSATNTLRYGTDNRFLSAESSYTGGQFSTDINGQYQLDENRSFDGNFQHNSDLTQFTLGQTNTFDGGSLRSYYQSGTNGFGNGLDLNLQQPGLNLSLGTFDQGSDGTLDSINAELGIEPNDLLELTLKYGLEASGTQTADLSARFGNDTNGGSLGYNYDGEQSRVSGSIQGEFGNWDASASTTVNLDTGTVEKLSAHLGMSTEEYTRFAIDFSHEASEALTRDELKVLYQTKISNFIIQSQAQYSYQQTGDELGQHNIGGALVGGYQINDRYTPYLGVATDFNMNTGENFTRPRAGLQVGDLNVFVEPTQGWEGAKFGIGIRF